MTGLRDYEEWHKAYNNPDSSLTWRLRKVQGFIHDALDRHSGPIRVLSSCSGDGRDLLGVLTQRLDPDRVAGTMIELHPGIAERARESVEAAGLSGIVVRSADAGISDSYEGAVPADLVILVGIFGNISDVDLERTIGTSPQFCCPGATLLWSRGRTPEDRNDAVRSWFFEAGFEELDYVYSDTGSHPALGVMRYSGEPRPLISGQRLFTFWR